MYKINIKDRKYESWDIIPFIEEPFVKVKVNIDPIESKLFHEDIFTLDEVTKQPIVVKSPIRQTPYFAGVLVLKGNKTYGKTKKLLYKCIPDRPNLPSFLIPYEIKNMGFSKVFQNLYVTFKFLHWDEKHPYGVLDQVIGTVDQLPHFYEYQLYCKYLNNSIQKFERTTLKAIQHLNNEKTSTDLFDRVREKYPKLEDRTESHNVFTIDPKESVDFDDGFSIRVLQDIEKPGKTRVLVSIYISNVPLLIDTLELWESFTDRVSTIYLPDKKRTMLPNILSDHLCSLREKTLRVAFVMDVTIVMDDNEPDLLPEIEKIEYKTALIKVVKNYVYQEPSLLNNLNYQLIWDVTLRVSKAAPYLPIVTDSHDLVAYWMILMNHRCAQDLMANNNGIFRAVSTKIPPISQESFFPKSYALYENLVGEYVDADSEKRHEALNLDCYVHITSPIRRLVDLLNMVQFQRNHEMVELSPKAWKFYHLWIERLEKVNQDTRDIRRVQNQCTLLELCSNTPGILEKKMEGVVFNRREKDRREKDDGFFFIYDVYLPELKILSRVAVPKERELNENETYFFQLYLFQDEESFKKKIRLSIHFIHFIHF